MTFRQNFGTFVCAGDSIECTVDGITYTATLHADTDTTPMDYDSPGWVFDTKAPGRLGARNRAIIASWERDEWHYFGVVIHAAADGACFRELGSIWGIEGNFGKAKKRNDYFRRAANDLLSAAAETVRERIGTLARYRSMLSNPGGDRGATQH